MNNTASSPANQISCGNGCNCLTQCGDFYEHTAKAKPAISDAPCDKCGYNGPGYYQPETHPCLTGYGASTAPPYPLPTLPLSASFSSGDVGFTAEQMFEYAQQAVNEAMAKTSGLSEAGEALYRAAINCAHEIDDDKVVLRFCSGKDGHNALDQLSRRLDAAAKRFSSDSDRLSAVADGSWDLRCFETPTGQGDADIGWRVIEHHMGKPHERIVGEAYTDDPRKAIDAAIAASMPETD